jgi:hypothetical protein
VNQPPDPQIADKAYLYGQFVQAAYKMFKNNNPDPLRPEPDGIPDGYELGAWIHMSDFIFRQQQLKFYGIVAHRKDDPNSRVIAIRGTEGAVEWIDDGDAIPVPFRHVPSAGRVAKGFEEIYTTIKVVKRRLPGIVAENATARAAAQGPDTYEGSFADQLDKEVTSRETERAFAAVAPEQRTTVVTGHSLGAALATLFVMENHAKRKFHITTLCTFASPRVGNMEFAHTMNQVPVNSWRIVNTRDLVPKLPPHVPIILDYGHVDMSHSFDSGEFGKTNLVCSHSMDTYLHWLKDSHAVSTDCAP